MKETLTKENFWDEMEQKYPKAMAHFKQWIDQYKSEHDWDRLFKMRPVSKQEAGFSWPTTYSLPKYHELPVAMQFGIFYQYLAHWRDKDGTITQGGPICSEKVILQAMRMTVTTCLTLIELKLRGDLG